MELPKPKGMCNSSKDTFWWNFFHNVEQKVNSKLFLKVDLADGIWRKEGAVT